MCLSVWYPPINHFGGYGEASLCPYYCEADSKAHPAQEVCRKRWRLSRGPADYAVLLNMEGRTGPSIASLLKVHRANVSIWLRNWQRYGMDGLLEGHRSGRPHGLTAKQRYHLCEILDSGPISYCFMSGVWTSVMITSVITEEFGVSYHPGHVRKLLQELGFSVQRPKRLLAQADKAQQHRWQRYTYPNLKKKRPEKKPH